LIKQHLTIRTHNS